MTWKLAVFNSNPASYKSPLYRLLHESEDIDITVFYGEDYGAKFEHGGERSYHLPLREGHPNEVLPNYLSTDPGNFSFLTNPALFNRIDGQYDALLLHAGYSSLSSLFAILSANLSDVPVLLHGTGHDNRPVSYRPSLPAKVLKEVFVRTVLIGVDHILADSTANKRYYESFGADSERVVLLPCAVDNKRFQQARQDLSKDEVRAIRDELAIPNDHLVILTVGQLIDRKRPKDLLDAFEQLSDDIDASLVFVGEGPLAEPLEETVQERDIENVKFAGFVPQPELPGYYELADVFVLPSAYDPSPKVLNEAMNFELPIITTETVGTAADLIAGNGAIVPLGNVDRLSERLAAILTHDVMRNRMGTRSLEIVDGWDFEADIRVIRDTLQAVTAGTN